MLINEHRYITRACTTIDTQKCVNRNWVTPRSSWYIKGIYMVRQKSKQKQKKDKIGFALPKPVIKLAKAGFPANFELICSQIGIGSILT